MSECISHYGEFSSHEYNTDPEAPISTRYVCGRCWAIDDDAMCDEIERLEGDLAVAVAEAQRVRAQRQAGLDLADALIADWSTVGAGVVANRIRVALGANGLQPPQEQP